MASKLTSISTFIGLAFVVGFFIFMLQDYAIELENNPNAELSANSIKYINNITGKEGFQSVDGDLYDEEIGNAIETTGADSKTDFSEDFQYSRSKADGIKRFAQIALGLPQFILIDLFRLTTLEKYAELLNWAFNIFFFVALYLFIKGRV